MTTMADLINKVLLKLEGTAGDTDIYGTLDAAITETDMEFVVNGSSFPDGSGFSTGLIEIGTELCYVQDIDRTTSTFSGVLRGFRGTTASAWDEGTLVRNNPRYPVSLVKDEINNVIKSLYPRILAPKKIELTSVSSRIQYDLPADALNVIYVSYLTTGSSKAWVPIKHWNFDNFGGSNNTTGKSINIGLPLSGRKVQVVYVSDPTELDYADEFTTTGLPFWIEEVVVTGACARLAAFIDASKVAFTSAEQQLFNNSNNIQSNSGGTNLSKFFLALYEQQLVNAQNRQAKELPIQKHFII
jgi:hypothetical protein